MLMCSIECAYFLVDTSLFLHNVFMHSLNVLCCCSFIAPPPSPPAPAAHISIPAYCQAQSHASHFAVSTVQLAPKLRGLS
jgi:hypothetical protein